MRNYDNWLDWNLTSEPDLTDTGKLLFYVLFIVQTQKYVFHGKRAYLDKLHF